MIDWLIDWLIDWGLTPFLTISQLYLGGQFTYSCISWFSHTSSPHNNLPKQLAAFPHRLSPRWWKTNDACRIDFCQSSERKLTEPRSELTTPWLTARVATGARRHMNASMGVWKWKRVNVFDCLKKSLMGNIVIDIFHILTSKNGHATKKVEPHILR